MVISFQLRLDFDTFSIAGPATNTENELFVLAGAPVKSVGPANTGISANFNTRCLTDTFSVTNNGGITPPTICGTNSGEHSEKSS